MRMSTKRRVNTVVSEIILVAISFIVMMPLILAVTMSLQRPTEVFSYPPKLFPSSFYLGNFPKALQTVNLSRLLLNSAIVAVMITLGKMITGVFAGYAFANFRFRGRRMAFAALFITLFLPAETVMILPLFLIMKKFGWVNTYWALTIPFMASATNTFLMRQHLLTIPKDLEEAAMLDGAGPMLYLWKILIPLSLPFLAGMSLVNFVYAWNMYLWPLIVTTSDDMKTVQIGVKMLIDAESANNWGVIMAGTLIALAPTLLLFFAVQNLFVKSLVRTGIKG